MTAVLALLSSVLWGSADFLGGTLARRVQAVAVVGASQALALLVIAPFVLISGSWRDPTGYLPWAVAAGLVGMVSLIAFYVALANGTMGVVAPIAATGVVVPVALGLANGERPAPLQLAGVLLAVAGVVLASGPELHRVSEHQPRGGARTLALAFAAAAGFGLVLWLLAKAGRYSVPMTLLAQRASSVAVALVLLVTVRTVGGLVRRDLRLLLIIGVGDAGANALYTWASRGALVSLVAVLGSLYPVVTVVAARVVHGERLRPVQNVGVVSALAGVVLIAARGV